MKNRKINSSLKRKIKKQASSYSIISQKVNNYQKIIQKTILYIQKYKTLDIIDAGDLNICIQNMENLYESYKNILLLIKDKANVDINDVANRRISAAMMRQRFWLPLSYHQSCSSPSPFLPASLWFLSAFLSSR